MLFHKKNLIFTGTTPDDLNVTTGISLKSCSDGNIGVRNHVYLPQLSPSQNVLTISLVFSCLTIQEGSFLKGSLVMIVCEGEQNLS